MKYYPPLNSTDPDAGYENADEVTGKFENCLPDARGFEATQREIANAIKTAGLNPADNDLTQLSQAIGKVAADKNLYSSESIKNTIAAAGLTIDNNNKSQLKSAVETIADTKTAYATKSIENAVTGAGLTLSKGDQNQLKTAIEKYTTDESARIMLVMNSHIKESRVSNVVLSCDNNPFLIGSELNRVTVSGGVVISMGLGLDEAHIRKNHMLDVPDGTTGTIPAESAAGLFSIIINLNGQLAFVRQYIESDVAPSGLSGTVVWWHIVANIMRISADGGATWADWHGTKVGEAYWDGSQITGISCKMPYQLSTQDDYIKSARALKNKQPMPFWTNAPFAVASGWVAPLDGWMRFGWWSNGNNQKAYIDNVEVGQLGTGGNAVAITSVCPIKAGQTFSGNPSSAYFIRGY